MGKAELSLRDNWQKNSGMKSKSSEITLTAILKEILPEDKYLVGSQVTNFKREYSEVILPEEIENRIFNPGEEVVQNSKWGWVPDNSITNIKTKKKIFIELKRQDGWVEGKKPSAGRGNAHERGLKHFAPGILEKEKTESGITDGFLPFILIYVGDITRDPKRNREIYYWFKGHQDNHFMWIADNNNKLDVEDLKKYLYDKVLPHLD